MEVKQYTYNTNYLTDFNFFSIIESQCTHGSIRLVGGSGNYEGNVQVCVNGTWGYVCDTGWTSTDATVVCSQLGYSTTCKVLQFNSVKYL